MGQVLVFVGQESVSVDVVRMDGSHMSEPADPPLIVRSDGRIDLIGLDLRLGMLSKRFPMVKVALIKLRENTTIEDAMPIFTRIRFGQTKGEERFTTLRVSLYESPSK